MSIKICGIYRITNKENGKSYIGQSQDIYDRIRRHKIATDQYVIHLALQKYGIENFDFEIIEECDKALLDEREKYWIQYYNSYLKGYNMTLGGQGGAFPDNEKKVKQYSLNGEYIATYPSLKIAGEQTNIDPRYISNCCLQKQNTAKGFQWCFVGNENLIQLTPKTNPGAEKKAVNQYDLQGNYIQTFSSLSEAVNTVGTACQKQIAFCCNNKTGSSKGFQWRYAQPNEKKIPNIMPYDKKINEKGHCCEPTVEVVVEQYSLDD